MSPTLLERSVPQAQIENAVTQLRAGVAGVVLISGEAGIGKTALLAAALPPVRPDAYGSDGVGSDGSGIRVLRGACDDLVAANPLGPLREATRGLPVAAAVTGGRLDDIAAGLGGGDRADPTVLIIEDLHWADDATLDVLGYLSRRLDSLRLLLVISYRDDQVRAGHPMQRFLAAAPADRTTRIELAPLSVVSVAQLSAGSGWDGVRLHELTEGNPFYLTETLAAPPDAPVPRTVADAVLARLRALSPRARSAVEQLSVWPGALDFGLAEDLVGDDFPALTEAEELGVLTVGADGLRFRHELARRATEASLSGLRRRHLGREVTAVLRSRLSPDAALGAEGGDSNLSRLVHHAIMGDDAATVAEFAPRAGRQSGAAGAHRQALTFYAAALRHADRLAPRVLADVLDGYAWELYNAHRFAEAVDAGRRAVAGWQGLGDARAEAEALGRLARYVFMTGDPDQARAYASRAVELSEAESPATLAYAELSLGSLLALDAQPAAAVRVLERAERVARVAERSDLVALGLNYQSLAREGLAPDARIDLLRRSMAMARSAGASEFVARGYTNLGEMLYRYGRYDALAEHVAEGLALTREQGFGSHGFNLELHGHLLQLRRGDWPAAEAGLLDLVRRYDDPGMLVVYSLPPYARLLARRDDPAAEGLLRSVWTRAQSQRLLIGLGFAGAALMEWAWLNDDAETGRGVLATWDAHAERPTAAPLLAEIRRYAVRLGLRVPPTGPDGSADPWAAGLAGHWQEAAERWGDLGDSYEQALELAASGQVKPTMQALAVLEELGASGAARHVRQRLRLLGVRSLPRGPRVQTRANPAGLTDRQLDIVQLLSQGLTNADIAARLVLSVRTVDSHVSSILAKLGVGTRREAAEIARTWPAAS